MSNGQRLIMGPFFYLGDLLTDGKLYTYESGTTTNKTVYSDRAQTTAETQPLTSDANGVFTFYTSGLTKFVLKDVNDTEISIWDETDTQIPITGTWTPTIKFGGANVGITYDTQTGLYTRVGDLVYVRMFLTLTSKGSSTGSAVIHGLPITSHATIPPGGFEMHTAATMVSLTGSILARPNFGGTTIILEDWAATGSAADVDETNFSDTTQIGLTGWYQAA
jgi:hypothetical protein